VSDLSLVLAMAVITFTSRAVFLVWPRPVPGGRWGRFLETFPLALFVALATLGLAAPDGDPEAGIALVAATGGVVGAVITRRSLPGILLVAGAFYWIARGFS